jgi:KDO2-lipid IV(A) lauroyltransferase
MTSRIPADTPLPRRVKWYAEYYFYCFIESFLSLLPSAAVSHFGGFLGILAWHLLPSRRRTVLRNLRIAFDGEYTPKQLVDLARKSFRRTGANLFAAAHTARLKPQALQRLVTLENPELLEEALRDGRGLVILLAHMGNWEILARINHLFPPGSRTGAFYRPLNNPLLDRRTVANRETDGTRLFSKRDNPHHVAGFLREGGMVGILADQRTGMQGEPVRFFGRLTRSSPLPSLLARRSRSQVLAFSLRMADRGKWIVRCHPVESPPGTASCMRALEQAMRQSPADVFWFQDRWKVYLSENHTLADWLGPEPHGQGKPHRALVWLAGATESWRIPATWLSPDVRYEAVLAPGQSLPSWLPPDALVHRSSAGAGRDALRKTIAGIDAAAALPIDFIVAAQASGALAKASRREAIPLVFPASA